MPRSATPGDAFRRVKAVGLTLPDVEAAIRYDGSPVLKLHDCFMAGLATHHSAEPNTLVVRIDVEEREWLVAEAPEIYYVTEYYRPHPVVLVRLQHIDRNALRDLLSVSRRLTLAKRRKLAGVEGSWVNSPARRTGWRATGPPGRSRR